MIIKKIVIENFKSIEKIEFDIKKYGNSYTTMFLGINESGKSNILQAMSFLKKPEEEYDYKDIHNQKDENNSPIDFWFYLDFENKFTYLDEIRKKIENGNELNFKIKSIVKNVYLLKSEKEFIENIDFKIEELTKNLFIKKISKDETIDGQVKNIETFKIVKKNDEGETYKELTETLFKEYFEDLIIKIIERVEPNVTFWKPSEQYLISDVDLNSFKNNISLNIPLKNIFALSGYKTEESIKEKIDEITSDQLSRKLMTHLSESTTKYVNQIWKHKIKVDIEINDSGKCVVSIKDEGIKNRYNYHKMTARSEGFKQFMSLILSLSIETKKLDKKNKLILIDEPEAHLHPSGIRDLRDELLEIGKDNYLFVSTHSPFLVDKKNKERNIIIKKNNSALTEKKQIKNEEDIRDDEVLDEAFGINIYKDLLIPHRILVEGASDKIILQKAFNIKDYVYGVTNGTGSNIVQVASKLNHDDINVLVITDDDKDGKKYKDDILKISGVYDKNNVFTIRDLVGNSTNNGTIEDLLGTDFFENKLKEFYKSEFKENCTLSLNDSPFIEQFKIFLHKEKKYNNEIIERFKKKLSNDFNPSKSSFDKKFPLLNSLIIEIKNKLK